MKSELVTRYHRRIRLNIIIVIIGLALSGITAYPLTAELAFISRNINLFPAFSEPWLLKISGSVSYVSVHYPWLNYGTDWLAFAHIMLAILFAGALKDPVKNNWVIEFGILACILIIPEALIAGSIRGIPFFWQMIDCCFGLIGIVPLWLARRGISSLKNSGY